MNERSHRFGLVVVTLGVLTFTPDALVMRLVGIDPFALAVFRSLVGGAAMTLGCLAVYGRGLPRENRRAPD